MNNNNNCITNISNMPTGSFCTECNASKELNNGNKINISTVKYISNL
jgi:hypothetical protein